MWICGALPWRQRSTALRSWKSLLRFQAISRGLHGSSCRVPSRARTGTISGSVSMGASRRDASLSPDPLHIDVGMWTDKPGYKAGDLVEVSVTVDRACHLTLINVSTRTAAPSCFYPNDLEPDNLIAPRMAVKVPGANAGYRLRFDRAGRETLVAYCQRSGVRMGGPRPRL